MTDSPQARPVAPVFPWGREPDLEKPEAGNLKENSRFLPGFSRVTCAKHRPWAAMARLEAGFETGHQLVGSAFFIGPTVLATAAHNLVWRDWGRRTWAKVRVARDGDHQHGPTLEVSDVKIAPGWAGDIEKPSHDYAVILLRDDQKTPGQPFFRLGDFRDPVGRLHGRLIGYTKDYASSDLYVSDGMIAPDHWKPGAIHYPMPTRAGFSGGPLCIYDGNEPIVIGVHVSRKGAGRACRVAGEAAKLFRAHAGQP